jgi:hypothetical protein
VFRKKTVIRGKNVISVEYNHIYLDCTVTVTFLQNGEFRKAQFHFNAATKNLYVPALNILLQNQTDYLEDVGTHENSVCSGLMQKSYLMLPISTRIFPYATFLRYFGANTIWYLQSQLVWFKLFMSFVFISNVLLLICFCCSWQTAASLYQKEFFIVLNAKAFSELPAQPGVFL